MRYVELLRDLVAFDTINHPAQNQRPNRDCPNYLQTYFAGLGLTSEILEKEGYYSVLGTWGNGRPVTLFIAHFDVVPIGPGWTSDPFELTIQNGHGYGRGTADDKGNVTALLLTAKAIVDQSIPGTIVFAVTGDEEIGGSHGAVAVRQRLEQQNLFPDFLVTADGTGMRIITRRRNTCGITITVPKEPSQLEGNLVQHHFTTEFFRRETRHSAYFAPGVDRHALLAASNFLRHHLHLKIIDVTGTFIKSNVVPDRVELRCIDPQQTSIESKKYAYDANLTRLLHALLPLSRIHFNAEPSNFGITLCPNLLYETEDTWQVYFDGRAMTTDTTSEEAAVQTVLKEQLSDIDYEVTIHMGKAFMNTPPTTRLVQTAQKIARQLNLNPQIIEMAAASDTRHFTDRPVEAIDFGPLGYAVHGPNEYVLLESIPTVAEFYTRLVRTLHHRNTD